ncbi:unnamed protein product [Cylindrotheca closterium]|uniref:Uncharacterized protein n=1 Tax=Cylindrotheca closterium TaxID=2856 RepID=A0AAD2FGE4_9STRA|nr:unnamed protein product [Cylindrotheca closterium]
MAPMNQDNPPGSMLDNAIESTKGGMDHVRAQVDEATKTEEQKEAEKTITEKIGDAIPHSAKEAGSNLGGLIDSGVEKVKHAISGDNEKK